MDSVNSIETALEMRLGEDAVRFLHKVFVREQRSGSPNQLFRLDDEQVIERVDDDDQMLKRFRKLSRLPAKTLEEYALALEKEQGFDDEYSRDCVAPLTNGVSVLALEYDMRKWLVEDEWDMPEVGLLAHLGLVSLHDPKEITLFGKQDVEKGKRLRLDIVAEHSVIEQCAEDVKRYFGFDFDSNITLINHRMIDNLTHRYRVGDESFCEWLGRTDKSIGYEIYSKEDETFADWVARTQVSLRDLEQFARLRDAYHGNIEKMLKVYKEQSRSVGPQLFLVESLIARGVITMMIGMKGTGKTNTLLELAVDVAEGRSTWLGFPLSVKSGLVVFLYGEDSEEEVVKRVRAMNGEKPMLLRLMRYDEGEGVMIEDIIKNLADEDVDLMIIDPVRKFYAGHEDSSDPVSAFFSKIEKFAHEKKAGLVIAHHCKRDAKPKSVHDLPRCMRGSQVWQDRPRTILAIHRKGDETQLGIPAPDGGDPLHNFGASYMFSGIRRLRRNEATFRHLPFEPAAAREADDADEGEADKSAMTMLTRLLAAGERVNLSYTRELFTYKPRAQEGSEPPPCELDGLSRAEVRAAVQRLIASGRVLRDASGALQLP
jgi:AAA domain